jgi:energy-coupling factor transporter ATP-binding protein EcfA2
VSGPAFLSVELAFGRHQRRWELVTGEPVLITGPNGSGKTTLVDGLLRTIYGFRRRADEERRLYDAREPWEGDDFRSAVRLRTAEGDVLDWSRDHATDEVEVRRDDDSLVFRGVANPGSAGSSDREYWELVEGVFGLATLENYAATAWVGQGELLGTEFGADLLRLAEGGHARLQAALKGIADRHKELTRKPVADGSRRMPRDGRLELDRTERERVRTELAAARTAVRAREATTARLHEVDADIDRLVSGIAELEALHTWLLNRARVDAELVGARQRFDALVELREELDGARREVADAERACAEFESVRGYPADFPARLAELESLWADGERETARRRRAADELGGAVPTARLVAPAAAGALTVIAGAAGTAAGAAWGVIALAAGLLLLVWPVSELVVLRRDRRTAAAERGRADEELARIDRRITELRDGIPDAATLGPTNATERREHFERARRADEQRAAAKRRLAGVMRRVERSPEARELPGRALPHLIADAERRLNACEAELSELEIGAPSGDVGFAASPRAARDAVRERERKLASLRNERERLIVELDRAVRAQACTTRLEREAEEVERRIDEAERTARALRAAWALLRDGYDAFRDHDEARLVGAVTKRLEGLGDPPLGPFRAEGGLGEPTVGLHGRRLGLDSAALSHGQRHLVLLAVRVGAADFLADGGCAAPLIVDEPFTHLDERHAAQVWELLSRVSEHRQVVVTTQERSLLERLGVEPTIRLSAGRLSNSGPPVRPGGETIRSAGATR